MVYPSFLEGGGPLKDLELSPELRCAGNIGKTNSVSLMFSRTPGTGVRADTSSFSLVFLWSCEETVDLTLVAVLVAVKDTFSHLKTSFSSKRFSFMKPRLLDYRNKWSKPNLEYSMFIKQSPIVFIIFKKYRSITIPE